MRSNSPTSTVRLAKSFLNLATRAASVALPPWNLEDSDPLPLLEVSKGKPGVERQGSPLSSLVKLCRTQIRSVIMLSFPCLVFACREYLLSILSAMGLHCPWSYNLRLLCLRSMLLRLNLSGLISSQLLATCKRNLILKTKSLDVKPLIEKNSRTLPWIKQSIDLSCVGCLCSHNMTPTMYNY